ncbi:hypothetical protein N7462_001346 [Penicillium macrosclerotiorum]|uniref:uncharacterized protein n=1 Tax=Penicillium macrosclerotiorum TaxID=303699 RepID=UPI0025485015|nr:uncharacterized protein N7462_001346 [Penicillium macrosclerotiorum]KAJ5691923.1 hypothetical protein N7462_001346 [Penicillium macrosclerotiorum]
MESAPQSTTLPPTMRAWVRRRRGPPATSLELADVPVPPTPPGSSADVLIRVSHVSLQFNSPFFISTLPSLPFTGPWIPELEFSGEVVAAGTGAPPEVRDPGTQVVAFSNVPGTVLKGQGVLCEYVRVPGGNVTRIPETMDMAAASGINGCGSTAVKMIRTSGVSPGHTVLVNGASGSVGSVLVQMLKMRGARVVAIASGGNEELVRGLGADEFVDYKSHDSLPAFLATEYGEQPFDFVFDCVGTQALFANSPAYLKPEGAVINIGAIEGIWSTTLGILSNWFLPTWLGGVPRRYIVFSTPPTRMATIHVVDLIEKRGLRVSVDSVFDMENALDAYVRIATKRARGKVVVKVCRDDGANI